MIVSKDFDGVRRVNTQMRDQNDVEAVRIVSRDKENPTSEVGCLAES